MKSLTFEIDVKEVGTVRCDINNVPRGYLQSRENPDSHTAYIFAHLTCKMRRSFSSLQVEVFVNDILVGRAAVGNSGPEPEASRSPQYRRRGSVSSSES